jgi:hypothetical protein
MRFHATIQLSGKTATGIEVPTDVVDGVSPGSRRPAVRVTINGYTYRSTVAAMRGVFMLPVSAEVREQAGVAAGDQLDVDIEIDAAPREVSVPADLSGALDLDPSARQAFAALSYSGRQRIVLSVQSARTAETRQRRIEKAVNDLSQGA